MTLVSSTNHYIGNILTPSELNSTTDVLTTSTTGSVSSYSGMDDSDSSSSSGGTTTISTTATLLSTLSSLQSTDADTFQDAAESIAENLHEAASETDDVTEKFQLESLAGKFSNAATTGSMSSLTLGGTNKSLRGYGGTNSNVFTSYLTGNLSGDLCSEVNDIVSDSLKAVLATAES